MPVTRLTRLRNATPLTARRHASVATQRSRATWRRAMIRAQTLRAAIVRAMARSVSRPLPATPSPSRTIREKLSSTSNPSPRGRATNRRQLLVPRSRAASTGPLVPAVSGSWRDATMEPAKLRGSLRKWTVPLRLRTASLPAKPSWVTSREPHDRHRRSAAIVSQPTARSRLDRRNLPRAAARGVWQPQRPAAAPCPTVLFLQGAERTADYLPGPTPRPADLRYLAVLTGLVSACRYENNGVDVALRFNLIARAGSGVWRRTAAAHLLRCEPGA